jgi:hypothetical protein
MPAKGRDWKIISRKRLEIDTLLGKEVFQFFSETTNTIFFKLCQTIVLLSRTDEESFIKLLSLVSEIFPVKGQKLWKFLINQWYKLEQCS